MGAQEGEGTAHPRVPNSIGRIGLGLPGQCHLYCSIATQAHTQSDFIVVAQLAQPACFLIFMYKEDARPPDKQHTPSLDMESLQGRVFCQPSRGQAASDGKSTLDGSPPRCLPWPRLEKAACEINRVSRKRNQVLEIKT